MQLGGASVRDASRRDDESGRRNQENLHQVWNKQSKLKKKEEEMEEEERR